MALGKLDIIIAGDTAQLRKDMSTAVGIMQSSTKTMENVAKTAGAALGGYFAFDMFKLQVQQTLDFADNLSKLSQKTGISTDALYSLNAAAKLSDVEFEALSGSLAKFNKNIGSASTGTGDAKKAFDSLGISVKNQDGTLKNTFDLMGEIADQFQEMPDGATKASIAMALFGKSGAQLIPLLNGGKDSLREYLGVMNDEAGKAAEAFNDSFTKIGIAIESLKINALKDFTPSMQSITVDIENVAKSMQEFSSNGSVNYYETVKEYAKDFTALGVALYGTPVLLKATAYSIDTIANSAVLSAGKMALFGNELESSVAKTVLLKNSTILLSTAFKTFAPTAALFAITEIFLNWDTITGKVYDNLEKISNFKIQEMVDKQQEYIKTLEDRKSKKEDSNGFLAFLGASWSTMDENTLRFAKQDLLVLQNQIAKNKEKINTEDKKSKSETGLPDESAIKSYNATLSAQIAGLEKQYDIKKQIENLNIESSIRNEAISKPEAERLKEINEISSQIAKNQETINLLKTKKYESGSTDEASDLQKINDLQREQELLIKKKTATEERYTATIKAGNAELQSSIASLNMSDTDKQYQDLAKNVANLIKEGKDLKLVGEYATIVADQISRNDAYMHLQTELDIRSQIAEVSLYGSEKEQALEQIRHDGVIANLNRELETKKLNADEYLKLLEIENQRNAQNSSAMYKFMLDAFDNINKAMDENFFNAMTGKFKSFGAWLKDLFNNIGTSIAQGLSRTFAGSLTQSLEGGIVNMFKTYGGSGAATTAASLIGTTISASEVSDLMNNGGTYDSAANTITTAGGTAVKLAEDGSGTVTSSGSDILSVASTISSIKTAYDIVTGGISASIMNGFNGVADILAGQGYWSTAAGVSNFGYGFANPFSYGAGSSAFTSTTIGAGLSAGLIGAGVGYGVGWLGDKLFGADTYAGTTGAIGGALGGIGASLGLWGGPVGILVGSVLGSVLGGIFGKTKVTGSGIDILGNATAEDADGRYYTSYKKKSWFSSKSWTTYTGFTDEEIAAIKKTIGAYDYMLGKLGEYNDLVVAGGRFANFQEFLDTNVVKAFLTAINPKNLDTIYQSWVDYAEEIDTTIAEAISTVVSGYITDKRDYEEWLLGDGTLKQLSFTSGYLKSDFEALSETLGASGVTIDNFLSMYDAAIKANFTQETITAWQNLGDALTASTDAAKAYQEALDKMNANSTSYRQSYTEWLLGSGTTEQLSYTSGYLKSNFEALASSLGASGVTVDNFLSMYDAAIKADFTEETITAWQSLGNALMASTDAAEAYKDALDELNDSTTYSLNSDMMLNNLNQTTEQVNLKSLISTQNDQNESIKSILFESLKSLKQLLKYEQMRITQ